jgi:hypothetical protein
MSILSSAAEGEPRGLIIPPELVLERFAVARNGEELMVPVRIAGKDHLFVVDTGASMTLFDTSLLLGMPVDVLRVDGAQDKVEVKLYNPISTLCKG